MLEPFLNVLSESKQLQLTVREPQWHQVNGRLYKKEIWMGLFSRLGAPPTPHSHTRKLNNTGPFYSAQNNSRGNKKHWRSLCLRLTCRVMKVCVCFNEYICTSFICVRHRWVFVEGSVQWGGCFDHWGMRDSGDGGWLMGIRRREWSRTCPTWANKLINSSVDKLKKGQWKKWGGWRLGAHSWVSGGLCWCGMVVLW